MRFLTKLVSGLATVATVASLAVVPSFVAAKDTVDAENEDTGFRSRNRNIFDIRRSYRVDRVRRADVRNTVNVSGDTGGNDQNENTMAGDQESGKVDLSGDLVNTVNHGDVEEDVLPESPEVDIDVHNSMTGSRSRNVNRVDLRHNVRMDVRNVADVRNTVNVNGMTGDNNQNKNTDAGEQDSGDVVVDLLVDNLVN